MEREGRRKFGVGGRVGGEQQMKVMFVLTVTL